MRELIDSGPDLLIPGSIHGLLGLAKPGEIVVERLEAPVDRRVRGLIGAAGFHGCPLIERVVANLFSLRRAACSDRGHGTYDCNCMWPKQAAFS